MYTGKYFLSYHAIVIVEQLILFFKDSLPANVFHKITGITDELKNNVHDQNEQTINIILDTSLPENRELFFYGHLAFTPSSFGINVE